MRLTALCWLVAGCLCPLLATGEVYTSIQDLKDVFAMEERLVIALSNYLGDMEAKLERIRKYLREYEQVSAEGTVGDEMTMERLAGNPVHAFHLMKRLTVDWRHLEDIAKSDPWMGVLETLRGSGMGSMGVRLPREEDLHGAAQALVRLHDVYNLNMTQLVQGNVWGVQSAAELTAQDCLYMGKHSFNLGLYLRAVQWFEEAYTLAGLESNTTVTQGQVNVFLNTAIKAHDDRVAEQNEADALEREEDFGTSLREEEKNRQEGSSTKNRRGGQITHRLAEVLTPKEDADNFQALCRGEKLLSPKYLATLNCFYDWRGEPYLRLMPAKVERQHWQPELLTFHNVLSDAEIGHIQLLAKPMLARAMVQGPQGKGNQVSSTRTSKVGWLEDTFDSLVLKIGRRISLLTGLSTDLSTEDAELLQVANYGIGGHYNPHHDYLLVDKTQHELTHNIHPRELVMGDRIATFMFYLSDVTRGGATAFPRLGTAVWPSKGSGAFWYNLKKSGHGDLATLHGACPVVHGSKWVSNKWIRERGQFLRRKCGLSPDE